VTDGSAQRFCAMGALLVAAYEVTGETQLANHLAGSAAKMISGTGSLVFVNDHVGHGAVLTLFDKALAGL